MTHLDTSVLVDAFSGPTRTALALRDMLERGERVLVSAMAFYEWLRGPRRADELAIQRTLVPDETVVPFGPVEAVLAAELYRRLPRARPRAADLAIAACALSRDAHLWTLNADDFRDVPGLTLYTPRD